MVWPTLGTEQNIRRYRLSDGDYMLRPTLANTLATILSQWLECLRLGAVRTDGQTVQKHNSAMAQQNVP